MPGTQIHFVLTNKKLLECKSECLLGVLKSSGERQLRLKKCGSQAPLLAVLLPLENWACP